jgi:hypothetical protein
MIAKKPWPNATVGEFFSEASPLGLGQSSPATFMCLHPMGQRSRSLGRAEGRVSAS